jgi:hypothetical protein
MPDRDEPKLSRRELLKLSAAAGVAWSLPWLPGCGDGSGSSSTPPPVGARESRILHLDLSNYDPTAVYRIHAAGSDGNRGAFQVHDDESLARLRADGPHLDGVDDARLTHYVDAIDLPAGRVQHVWVTQEGRNGDSTIVLSTIYVPIFFRVTVAQLLASGMVGGAPGPAPELDALQNRNLHINTRDAAMAVVYHHPQLIRLDPLQAAIVRELIEETGTLDLLADHIYSLGPDWITKVPVVGVDGTPLRGPDGKQYIQQDPSDATMQVAEQVITDALRLVNDELSLEGKNWHLGTGRVSESQPSLAGADPDAVLDALEADGFAAKPRYLKGCNLHGVIVHDVTLDQAKRTVHMPVRNTWLRFLGVYAEFFNAAGKRVDPYGGDLSDKNIYAQLDLPLGSDQAHAQQRCLNVSVTNTDYLGIPFRAQDVVPTPIAIRFPTAASRATIHFGTLGVGQPFTQVSTVGASATLVVNIGVPALLLATTVGSESLTSFTQVFKDVPTLLKLTTLLPASIYDSIGLGDARPALYTFGRIGVDICLNALPPLARVLAQKIGTAALQQAIPVAGWIVKAATIGASLAALGQTIYEVMSSPAAFTNTIDLVMNTRVTIHHDPENFQFPASATHYLLTADYSESLGYEIRGELPTTRSEPIVEVFREVPAGGFASIRVVFLNANDDVVGHGATPEFVNTPELASAKEITIKEVLVALNQRTRYSHKQKLANRDGAHVWQAADAPTATRFDLNCDESSLCELSGITVSQEAAAAGYAWRARGAAEICAGGPVSAPAYRIQGISITQNPDAGLKLGHCAYLAKPLLSYALSTEPGGRRGSFYVDPTGNGFHLRSVTLGGRTPFEQNTRLSWGAFSQPIDSLAIHPSGFAVAVNTQNHRLEIIALRDQALPDAEVGFASVKAGPGRRIGLLDTPIAVGVDLTSRAVLVLEGGDARRVQAFDCFGNQLLHFAGATSPVMALRDTGAAAVNYLDMAVESTGFIYVLSSQGDGVAAGDYRLDIYNPDGGWLSQTSGVAAAKLAIDRFRNLYTLNYEALHGPRGIEPSISAWVPVTPRPEEQG